MSRPAAKWSTAYSRFGLGARATDGARGDPREALEAELGAPGAGLVQNPDLGSTAQSLKIFFDYNAQRAEEAKTQSRAAAPSPSPTPSVSPSPPAGAMASADMMKPAAETAPQKTPPSPIALIYQAEATARIEAGCAAPIGFVERLVAFWSNHFCISANKGLNVRAIAGAFEREAIRPHVLGKFADMLRAVEGHPAMLYFLDNAQSIGPTSRAGQNGKHGLNENLAREILELHTLGVDGGYAQADVTEFARILTGWTVVGREGKLGAPGDFVFNANAHEGGARQLLGRRYDPADLSQGEAALADLACAPATARHIAFKLARAFVADAPPPGLVQRLAQTFQTSNGDLAALARTLLEDETAWSAPPTKIRDPWEMMIAGYRALALDPSKPQRILHSLNLLGMPLWSPAGPNGFSDLTDAWLSSEGIKTRVEIAAGLGRIAKDAPAPPELIERVLPDASPATREAVLRAESRPQAYALLILSPEFQRR